MSDLELIKKFVAPDEQEEAIKKLNAGYPVQYIIGNVDFYGSIINVDNNVLIPRFETEFLVDKTIKCLKSLNIRALNVLEIGTGSGCIAISLKKNLDCEIDAIDINKNAIKIASENARNNQVDINFQVLDIHYFQTDKKYDLIISNPPYVPLGSKVDVKIKYEPQDAIYAAQNGLYFYNIILGKIKNNLNNDYLIAFEIGDKQGELIKKIVHYYLPFAHIKVERDLNNYERYVFISNKQILI